MHLAELGLINEIKNADDQNGIEAIKLYLSEYLASLRSINKIKRQNIKFLKRSTADFEEVLKYLNIDIINIDGYRFVTSNDCARLQSYLSSPASYIVERNRGDDQCQV